MSAALRFGHFELQPDRRRLLAHGEPVVLGQRAFELLQALIERRHRPVPKGELLDLVWPGQDVEEGNLPVQMSTLRKLLGPQSIATVPGLGYRFMLSLHGDDRRAADEAPVESRGNLRRRSAPIHGRDRELATLRAELGCVPLLSLVGPSGIGKTRLALAAVQDESVQGDVWWVDLADTDDARWLAAAVGAPFGLAVDRAAEPLDALVQGLRHQHCLIVLDNCEHLVAAVAQLVQLLLDQAPGVRWLLTTQEPARLPLESVMRVGPLEVPAAATPWPQALAAGAMALLQARAQAVDRRFQLDVDTVGVAIEICARLDGLPLAIEMAAARLPRLGLVGVRDRLAERFRLLAADDRHSPARHRTLLAALDWSHALLDEVERDALRRLSVFSGGFALEAAQQLLDDDPTSWQAIDTLVALVDKSLVHVDGASLDPRYRLLESTRLYAQARLSEVGQAHAVGERHAEVMARMAAVGLERLWVESDRLWLAQWSPEVDNLRLALTWSVRERRAAWVAPLFELLGWVDSLQGGSTAVRSWCEAVEPLADGAEPAVAAQLLTGLGAVLRNHAPQRSLTAYQAAGRLLRDHDDAMGLFRLLSSCAIQLARVGQNEAAREQLEQAQGLMQADWPARLRLLEADAAGFVTSFEGDRQAARRHYRRMRALALEAGVDGALTVVSVNLADVALALGDAEEAVRIGREHVAALRRKRNPFWLGWALGNLCAALLRSDLLDEAEAAGREALVLMRREGHAAWLFDHFALLAARRGDACRAARLAGYADASRERTQSVREPIEAQALDEALAIAQAVCGAGTCGDLRRAGAALTDPQADALAFSSEAEHGDGEARRICSP